VGECRFSVYTEHSHGESVANPHPKHLLGKFQLAHRLLSQHGIGVALGPFEKKLEGGG